MSKWNPENAHKSKTGSLRYNQGKPEMSQLDPEFLLELADMMTEAAKKYGKHNWKLGQAYSTPYDSCMRHLLAFMSGEDMDKESGKSHILHSVANLMILWYTWKHCDQELDDRYKEEKK